MEKSLSLQVAYTDWQPLHTSYLFIDMGVSSMSRNVQLQFLPIKEGNTTNRNCVKKSGYDNVIRISYLEIYVCM